MLTEFAFTPSVFDETAHDDVDAWCEQLRRLSSSMFPETSAWSIIVSDLFAGAWSSQVFPFVAKIKDPKARRLCQGLATQMKRMLVSRPICGSWPESDPAWCREAISASQLEAIERIVSTRATKVAFPQMPSVVRSIDEVMDKGFWAGIKSDASPPMVIADQVELLRKLCLHSEWVSLINPYGLTSEQDFGIKLLQATFTRNASYGQPDFDFHCQEPDTPDPVGKAQRQQNLVNGLKRSIRGFHSGSQSVNLYFWPKLRERLLIAGIYARESDGTKRKSPRWGVSMNHVAHQKDAPTDDTEWKLLRPDRLGVWFSRFVSEDAPNQPQPILV